VVGGGSNIRAMLLVVVVCSILRICSAVESPKVQILKSAEPVTVDGRLDEPCWGRAQAIRVDYIVGRRGELSAVPHMVVKYCWDDQYLYIGYETFDTNLVAAGEGKFDGPPGNRRETCAQSCLDAKMDLVEFFITFGGNRGAWEIHHNALNCFSDLRVAIHPPDPLAQVSNDSDMKLPRGGQLHIDGLQFIADGKKCKLASAVALKSRYPEKPSTVNDPRDTDVGYTAEIRLPWVGLMAAQETHRSGDNDKESADMSGRNVRILAVMSDNDGATQYYHSSPTFGGGWFHAGITTWPEYWMREDKRIKQDH
jgi:hypothetical protein